MDVPVWNLLPLLWFASGEKLWFLELTLATPLGSGIEVRQPLVGRKVGEAELCIVQAITLRIIR